VRWKLKEIAEITGVIKDIIREIVDEEFNEEEPLIMTHCIDSMDIVEIASAMESKFNIQVRGEEVTIANFDTISKMSDYISRKLAGRKDKYDTSQ